MEALHSLAAASVALHECSLSDCPDVPARPVKQLAELVAEANRHCDATRYDLAGRDIAAVLTELHVHVISGPPDVRRAALVALAEACIVASGVARPLGSGVWIRPRQRSLPWIQPTGAPGSIWICPAPTLDRRAPRRVWELDSLRNRFGLVARH